jgi:hypothetical protein
MKFPPQTEAASWGAIGGAVLLAVIGFNVADWQTAGKSEALGTKRVTAAVAAALAPVCADAFRRDANYAANLVELQKTDEWSRPAYLEKGGWGRMPDTAKLDNDTSRSCAALLVKA